METVELLNELYKKLSPSKINPTVIFNEGWMTRLLVIESMRIGIVIDDIDFRNLAKKEWSSEALISSPFVGIDKNPEGYTHADIILGDFKIDYLNRGEITVKDDAQILGIIEAKMGSNLSQDTSNAKDYNQASRNICCLAHNTINFSTCDIFFMVVAPENKIKSNKIIDQVSKEKVSKQIKQRFSHSDKGECYTTELKNKADECIISVISYEKWIDVFKGDPIEVKLRDFYNNCKEYNKIK